METPEQSSGRPVSLNRNARSLTPGVKTPCNLKTLVPKKLRLVEELLRLLDRRRSHGRHTLMGAMRRPIWAPFMPGDDTAPRHPQMVAGRVFSASTPGTGERLSWAGAPTHAGIVRASTAMGTSRRRRPSTPSPSWRGTTSLGRTESTTRMTRSRSWSSTPSVAKCLQATATRSNSRRPFHLAGGLRSDGRHVRH